METYKMTRKIEEVYLESGSENIHANYDLPLAWMVRYSDGYESPICREWEAKNATEALDILEWKEIREEDAACERAERLAGC
jgi:hypothetical protein